MFTRGTIHDVVVKPLVKFIDDRGWLTEVFRSDEVDPQYSPVMTYVSMTGPGVTRGPHEHAHQADLFAFLGPSNFKINLWDNRKGSPTYGTHQVVYAGDDAPKSLLIPPGVVHAYKNIGDKTGMVVNSPNRLYAGRGKKDPVDEIRHEGDPASPFTID